MTYSILILLLSSVGAVLWWRLSRAHIRNAQLLEEIVKLRGKLRTLRND